MTSVARAGHLAPFFKASSQVVSSGIKPLVAAVPISTEKVTAQPLPKTTTVHALHGSLPIRGLKVRCGPTGRFILVFSVYKSVKLRYIIEENSYYITRL